MSKPNLICIHGALGCGENLAEIALELSSQFECFIFELPFHGKTKAYGNFEMQDFAEELEVFAKKFNISEYFVFGYSMGGYIACLSHLSGNSALKKIYTLGTKFHWNSDEASKETAFLNPDKIIQKVPHYAAMLEKTHTSFGWQNMLLKTADLMLGLGKNNLLSQEKLSKITIPVCVAVGEFDTMVTPAQAQNTFETIPNATLAVIKNSYHTLDKTDLKLLSQNILQFLID